jgi:hypothetical protein
MTDYAYLCPVLKLDKSPFGTYLVTGDYIAGKRTSLSRGPYFSGDAVRTHCVRVLKSWLHEIGVKLEEAEKYGIR